MQKLQNGNDVAVYLRNNLLAMMGIAREYGISISAYCNKDGTYGNVDFGDFTITEFCNDKDIGTREYCQYRAKEIARAFDIQPQDVALNKKP